MTLRRSQVSRWPMVACRRIVTLSSSHTSELGDGSNSDKTKTLQLHQQPPFWFLLRLLFVVVSPILAKSNTKSFLRAMKICSIKRNKSGAAFFFSF